MSKYFRYLRAMYTRKLDTFEQWPPVHLSEYIPVMLSEVTYEDTEDAIKGKAKMILSGDIDGAFSTKQQFSSDTLIASCLKGGATGSGRAILVEGAPGIGKTALSYTLCQKWAAGSLLHGFKGIIRWSLSELMQSAVSSVSDLVMHDSLRVKEEAVRVLCEESGESILFIFDGWDEIPQSAQRGSVNFLLDLIKGKKLPKASHVVTSRSLQAKKLFKLNRSLFDYCFEITGFSDQNIEEYIHKAFVGHPAEEPRVLLHQLEARPDIHSMCYVPIHCAIVVYVFRQKKKLPRTLTEFYQVFVLNSLLRNLQLRVEGGKEIDELDSLCHLPKSISDVFLKLSELAFRGLWADKHAYSEEEVQTVVLSTAAKIDQLGVLQTQQVFHATGTRMSFHFLHSSVQQFLAAYFLTTLPHEEQRSHTLAYITYGPFYTVWQFYCGLCSYSQLEKSGFLQITSTEVKDPNQDLIDVISSSTLDSDRGDITSESEDEIPIVNFTNPHIVSLFGEEPTLEQHNDASFSSSMDAEGPSTTLVTSTSIIPEGPSIKLCSSHEPHPYTTLSPSTVQGPLPSASPPSASMMPLQSISTALSASPPLTSIMPQGPPSTVLSSSPPTPMKDGLILQPPSMTLDDLRSVAKMPISAYKREAHTLLFFMKCAYEFKDSALSRYIINLLKHCLLIHNFKIKKVDMVYVGFLFRNASDAFEVHITNCGLEAGHLSILRHQVMQAAKKPVSLKKLFLRSNNLSSAGAGELKKLAPVLKNCTVLDISYNDLGDDGLRHITKLLSSTPQLKVMCIASNDIHNIGDFCDALTALPLLTHLYFNINPIGCEAATHFSSILSKCQSLTHLGLGNISLGDNGIQLLAEELAQAHSLKHLDLEDNEISEIGAAYLANVLHKCSITKLILGSNAIGSSGASLIFSSLSSCKSLQYLDISGCSIERNDLFLVSLHTLLTNVPVKKLDVSFNPLTDEGLASIVNITLDKSCTVHYLVMAMTGMKILAAKALETALVEDSKLTHLVLSGTEFLGIQITDSDSFHDLVESFVQSQSLKALKFTVTNNEMKSQLKEYMSFVNERRKDKVRVRFQECEDASAEDYYYMSSDDEMSSEEEEEEVLLEEEIVG